MRRAVITVVATLAIVAVGGCAELAQLPGAELAAPQAPKAVVGQVLAAIADDDLVAASGYVCPDFRSPTTIPIPLAIRFGLSRLPGVSDAEVLSVMDLDFSELRAEERVHDPESASVALTGAIGLRYDVAAVRALALASTGGTDPDTVETVMAVVGAGSFDITHGGSVWLTKTDGRWMVCEPPPG
jgi:hypothetical protein